MLVATDPNVATCLAKAEENEQLAVRSHDDIARQQYRHMAELWRRLAESYAHTQRVDDFLKS